MKSWLPVIFIIVLALGSVSASAYLTLHKGEVKIVMPEEDEEMLEEASETETEEPTEELPE